MTDLIVKGLKIAALIAIVATIVGWIAGTFIPALSGFSDAINGFINVASEHLYCARATLNWMFGYHVTNVFLIAFFTLPFVKMGTRWIWRLQNLDQN